MKQIDLTNPQIIESFIPSGWTVLPADVRIAIAEDGTVSVTAAESGLLKIRFSYSAPELNDLYQYGDALERAYGELEWSKNRRTVVWYTMFTDEKTTAGYGVKTGPNALCFWDYDRGVLSITFDLRNGTDPLFLNENTLEIATLVSALYEGSVHDAARDFCALMCPNPRLPGNPIYGGNDWYCNYGDNSFDKILTHAKRVAECAPHTDKRPYMVIDEGWELCRSLNPDYFGGPWKANALFGDMKKMADAIKEQNVIPGIWFRPLLTLERIPDPWILRKDNTVHTMDPSHPEVLGKVASDVKKIVGWGYKLIKHDFLSFEIFRNWFFELPKDIYRHPVHFSDKTKTTAQIIKNFYQTIRDAAGDDIMIIGCNTVSHLAAGIFEIQRTGDDTSGKDWARTKQMGINTLALRMPQHNTFYAADADCVGITKDVDWELNAQWLDVLAKSGTPLFVSMAEDAYSDTVKTAVTAAFEKAAEVHNPSIPVDLINNRTPEIWESDFGKDHYHWN